MYGAKRGSRKNFSHSTVFQSILYCKLTNEIKLINEKITKLSTNKSLIYDVNVNQLSSDDMNSFQKNDMVSYKKNIFYKC